MFLEQSEQLLMHGDRRNSLCFEWMQQGMSRQVKFCKGTSNVMHSIGRIGGFYATLLLDRASWLAGLIDVGVLFCVLGM